MKSQARVVVIGGGVIGCSVLYHLTKCGWTDVMLLERAELTAGSTWHAAGGVHTLNGNPKVAELQKYTINLYPALEREAGIDCGVHRTGCLYLAVTDQQIEFFRSERDKARQMNIELDFVSLEVAQRLNPLIQTTDYRAAMFDPNDGHVDPSGVTHAYAQAARRAGAAIHRRTEVTRLSQLSGGEWRVETNRGEVRAEYVVNAAGLWAREVGRMMGVDLPIVPMEHQYIVTNDIPELAALDREIPAAVDFHGAAYLRQERHGLLLGTYEQDCRHWAVEGTPLDFGVELLAPDIERIAESLSLVLERMPALGRAGIKRVVNGGMVFSPDGNPIIGPLMGVRNGFVAAGVMAGFSQGGGVGLALARWITEGEPGMDVFAMDVARYGRFAGEAYVLEKTRENYQRRFVLSAPDEELSAARPLRTSPVYDRLVAEGAAFGVTAGWEVPLWFATSASDTGDASTFRRRRPCDAIAAGCRQVRQRVGIWETSSYCKIEIRGEHAAVWLEELVANRIPPAAGQITLCPLLTQHGRLLGDVIVARISSDQFLLIGSPAAELVYLRWLEVHLPTQAPRITSLTDALCGLAITGPLAREVLQRACREDLSNIAFPFMRVRQLTVGLAPVLALRISYTGELGYELYMRPDLQRHVYEALTRAGQSCAIRPFGARALNCLRLEKGYRGWGHELTQDFTMIESGLDHLMRPEKRFIGREATLAEQQRSPTRKLRLLSIETRSPGALGGEAVYFRGEPVARLTSAAFGHTVGRALGFAYLPIGVTSQSSKLAAQIDSALVTARVLDEVPYDPRGARLRS